VKLASDGFSVLPYCSSTRRSTVGQRYYFSKHCGALSRRTPSFISLRSVAWFFTSLCSAIWNGALLEEGAPQTFRFFYDENDERVSYASVLADLDGAQLSQSADASHIDALCSQSAGLFARYADLPAGGLDFRDLARWWLRRDRVWEMRVLCDQLRFRWPYSRSVKSQQRAIALFRELDESMGVQERARMALRDRDLAILETRQLILNWMARRENWLKRAFDFVEQIVDHTQALREYIDDPSPVGWRKLQRVLMTTLRPASPFEGCGRV
jgi:hypothetical protein